MIHRSGLVALLVLSGCTMDVGASSEYEMVTDCDITGSGAHAEGDSGGGTVAVTGGVFGSGSWSHTTRAGDVLSLSVTGGTCLINGDTIATVTGSIDDGSGDFFAVRIQDRGEPGVTSIHEGAPTVETLVASRFYRPTAFVDAALPIADQARVTIPAVLPVTNGEPGTGHAVLSITRADTGDTIRCTYRGDGARSRGGTEYVLHQCRGLHGMPEILAGDVVDVTELTLRVQSGDSHSSRCSGDPETTVTLDLEVTPLTVVVGELDDYAFVRMEWDPVDGLTPTMREEGTIVSGDFSVTRSAL